MGEPPRHIARYSTENSVCEGGERLRSPSFDRNFIPIRDALEPYLEGRTGSVLEIGSGTGQHIAHLAETFSELDWVPSDIHALHLASIAAWGAAVKRANLAEPLELDAAAAWDAEPAVAALPEVRAVLCFNVIHIAPWAVAEGVVGGAGRVLAPGGHLIFYGPFREHGRHTGAGNASFDAALQAENPDWGVRDLDAVAALATAARFGPAQVTRMPSNNLLVAFQRI